MSVKENTKNSFNGDKKIFQRQHYKDETFYKHKCKRIVLQTKLVISTMVYLQVVQGSKVRWKQIRKRNLSKPNLAAISRELVLHTLETFYSSLC